MKTILVLTDFSKNSRNAAEAAVATADKMGGANILLFHAYLKPPFMPSTEFAAWPPEYYSGIKEDSIIQTKKECRRLERFLLNQKISPGKIIISYEHAEGTVAEHLMPLISKKDVMLTVMGGRENTTGDFLFGNVINSVISKSACPTLIVSHKQLMNIKNIIFATDLDIIDIEAIKYLAELSKSLHFHLHICHVSSPPVFLPDFNEEDKAAAFRYAMAKLEFEDISYHNLQGGHIVKELESFAQKINSDLLVFANRKHSFFWQIFHSSPSKALIRHHKNSLLILPEHWNVKAAADTADNRTIKVKRPRLQIL